MLFLCQRQRFVAVVSAWTKLIFHLAPPPEPLCHGPPQCPQGEAAASPASLSHPCHEHRRGPGRAGRHVSSARLEEEEAEGVQTEVGGNFTQNPPSTEEEGGAHGGGVGPHQRGRQAGVWMHHRGEMWRQLIRLVCQVDHLEKLSKPGLALWPFKDNVHFSFSLSQVSRSAAPHPCWSDRTWRWRRRWTLTWTEQWRRGLTKQAEGHP